MMKTSGKYIKLEEQESKEFSFVETMMEDTKPEEIIVETTSKDTPKADKTTTQNTKEMRYSVYENVAEMKENEYAIVTKSSSKAVNKSDKLKTPEVKTVTNFQKTSNMETTLETEKKKTLNPKTDTCVRMNVESINLAPGQENESICVNSVSSQFTQASADLITDTGAEALHVNSLELGKEECEEILHNINKNIQTLLHSPVFQTETKYQQLVRQVLNVLGTSVDVVEVVITLRKMNLDKFTKEITNLESLINKDFSPSLAEADDNVINIINKNIKMFCDAPGYENNETLQRKVRTVLNILVKAGSAEDVLDMLHLEGLQYFAENKPKHSQTEENSRSRSRGRSKEGVHVTFLSPEPKSKIHSNSYSVNKAHLEMGVRSPPRIERNKESRKVKKFTRVSSGSRTRRETLDGSVFDSLSEDLKEQAEESESKQAESKIKNTVERKVLLDASSISHAELDFKQNKFSLQRSFTEVIKDTDEYRSVKIKKKSLIDDTNSIVSKILKEKAKTENINEQIEDTEMNVDNAHIENSAASLEKSKEPPQQNNPKDNKHFEKRDRTESVCSENMPDLCPIESEENQDDPTIIPSIEPKHELENEVQVQTHKNVNLFALTSFDQDVESDDDISEDSRSNSEGCTSNLIFQRFNETKTLESKITEELNRLMEISLYGTDQETSKNEFVKFVINEVTESLNVKRETKNESSDAREEEDNETPNDNLEKVREVLLLPVPAEEMIRRITKIVALTKIED